MIRNLILILLVTAAHASAGTFHVATTGDNANPGTQAEPWRDIQFAVDSVSSGDVIHVKAGVYVEDVDVDTDDIEIRGEAGVILEAPNPGTSQEAFDIKPGTSGVLIRDFEARGGYGETVFIRPGASDITIKAWEAHGNTVGAVISGADDINIQEGDVHDNTNGISIVNSTNVRIKNTDSYDNTDGLGCGGDADGFVADSDSDNVQCTNCRAWGNSEDGYDLQASRSKVQESEAWGNCRGIRFWSDGSFCKNCLVYGNSNVGFTTTMLTEGSGTKIEVYNSTIDNPVSAFDANANASRPYRLFLYNNVFTSSGKVVEVQNNIDVRSRNNLYWRSSGSQTYRIVGSPPTISYSNADIEDGTFHDETGDGLNTRAVDPDYVDAAGDDYQLQSSSVAIDAGFDFAVAPVIDLLGVSRPAGAEYDMGAYENQ